MPCVHCAIQMCTMKGCMCTVLYKYYSVSRLLYILKKKLEENISSLLKYNVLSVKLPKSALFQVFQEQNAMKYYNLLLSRKFLL